jgi:hypothetical protein
MEREGALNSRGMVSAQSFSVSMPHKRPAIAVAQTSLPCLLWPGWGLLLALLLCPRAVACLIICVSFPAWFCLVCTFSAACSNC